MAANSVYINLVPLNLNCILNLTVTCFLSIYMIHPCIQPFQDKIVNAHKYDYYLLSKNTNKCTYRNKSCFMFAFVCKKKFRFKMHIRNGTVLCIQ